MARVKPVDWALEAKIVVVFLFAAFPILINTYQGVRKCDKNILEVARSFRSPEWKMWQDVLLPFALPYIAAGIWAAENFNYRSTASPSLSPQQPMDHVFYGVDATKKPMAAPLGADNTYRSLSAWA